MGGAGFRRLIDPIQRVIDWQLRSIAGALGELPGGGNPRLLEDLIVEALDEKYANISRLDMMMLDYVRAGFSLKEIGEMYGMTERGVRKRVERVLENCDVSY